MYQRSENVMFHTEGGLLWVDNNTYVVVILTLEYNVNPLWF